MGLQKQSLGNTVLQNTNQRPLVTSTDSRLSFKVVLILPVCPVSTPTGHPVPPPPLLTPVHHRHFLPFYKIYCRSSFLPLTFLSNTLPSPLPPSLTCALKSAPVTFLLALGTKSTA